MRLTRELAALVAAEVVHEHEVRRGLPRGPRADLRPRRRVRAGRLVHRDVVQVQRPAEVERHLLVERREVPYSSWQVRNQPSSRP